MDMEERYDLAMKGLKIVEQNLETIEYVLNNMNVDRSKDIEFLAIGDLTELDNEIQSDLVSAIKGEITIKQKKLLDKIHELVKELKQEIDFWCIM